MAPVLPSFDITNEIEVTEKSGELILIEEVGQRWPGIALQVLDGVVAVEVLHGLHPSEPIGLLVADVDLPADTLTYTVVAPPTHGTVNGSFTQADLEAGKVIFVHNGATGPMAGFDVIVADNSGATSGPPKTVEVDVNPAL